MRKIIHIDMDAFYASIEQRDHPELRGKPVAVGYAFERGVVAAASYEARKYGVRSAMPSLTAMQRCPQLIFVPARFDVYRKVSRQIRRIFLAFTDLVEPLSLDEAYLDVTVNRFGIASATYIAREIKHMILKTTGLTASAGVSVNKFLAKIASDYRKPDGLFVVLPEDAESFTEQLRIEQFWGVGRVTAQKMRGLGIHCGSDLKRFSETELVRQFGKAGHSYYLNARGIDDRPVEPHRERKSIGAERTFQHDTDDPEALRAFLTEIAQDVWRRLSRRGLFGRTSTLKIKFADFGEISRRKTFEQPVRDYCVFLQIARELFAAVETNGKKIRLIGLTSSGFKDAMPGGFHQRTLGLEEPEGAE